MALGFAINGGGKAYEPGKTLRRHYVERYRIYRDNHANGRLHGDFDDLSVIRMRQTLITGGYFGTRQGLEYLISERNDRRGTYTGACWAVPYRRYNPFGSSIHGRDYYWPWQHRWPKSKTYDVVGGVCGSLSTFGAESARVHGIPAMTAGQPGHCAYLVEVTDGRWSIGNHVGGRTGPKASYWRGSMEFLGLAAQALQDEQALKRAWSLYALGRSLNPHAGADDAGPLSEMEVACYRAALQHAPLQYGLWNRFGNRMTAASNTTEADWNAFTEQVISSFKAYPGVGWDVLNRYPIAQLKKKADQRLLLDFMLDCHRKLPSYGHVAGNLANFAAGMPRYDAFTELLDCYAGTPGYYALLQANVAFAKDPATAEAYNKLVQADVSEDNVDKMIVTMTHLATTATQNNDLNAWLELRDVTAGKLADNALWRRLFLNAGQAAAYPKLPTFSGKLVSDRALVTASSSHRAHDRPLFGHQRLGLDNNTVGWLMTNPEKEPWCTLTLPNFVRLTGVAVVTRYEFGDRETSSPIPLQLLVSKDGENWEPVTTFDTYAPVLSHKWNTPGPRITHLKLQAKFPDDSPQALQLRNVIIYGQPEF